MAITIEKSSLDKELQANPDSSYSNCQSCTSSIGPDCQPILNRHTVATRSVAFIASTIACCSDVLQQVFFLLHVYQMFTTSVVNLCLQNYYPTPSETLFQKDRFSKWKIDVTVFHFVFNKCFTLID